MVGKNFRKIVVLATGGTIAGVANDPAKPTRYQAGVLSIEALLPRDMAADGVLLEAEQVAQIDSKDMTHALWQTLARRCVHWLAQPEVGGMLITHGTDTLEETAWFLQQVLETAKPVVLTCAMRPASDPEPDGPQNLRDALAVLRDPGAQGVLAVCAGQVHSAQAVQKVHPSRLDAFGSGEAGPLGRVVQGQVQWADSAPRHEPMAPHAQARQALTQAPADWPWVAVLGSHAGVDARQVHALVSAGVQGLVVAGTGNGTVHQTLLAALHEAQVQGVAVRLSTRCTEGQISGEPVDLPLAPRGLNAYKARIGLMLDLMAGEQPQMMPQRMAGTSSAATRASPK